MIPKENIIEWKSTVPWNEMIMVEQEVNHLQESSIWRI